MRGLGGSVLIERGARWTDRVKEYLNERGVRGGVGLERARRECMDRERWKMER